MPQNSDMQKINMLDKVVTELEARTGDLKKVAFETGIPYDTILRVKNRENDPAFSRVAVLHDYLFLAQQTPALTATKPVADKG